MIKVLLRLSGTFVPRTGVLLCLKTVETEGRNKKPPARRVEKSLSKGTTKVIM